MPGPPPKPAGVRARRNTASTKATLRAVSDLEVPELPEGDEFGWNRLTLAWWRDIWSSPMAPEFDASDVHGLYALAMLVNDFWQPSLSAVSRSKVAAEIRLQGQRFGLSPLDRRRLQWEIEHAEEAQAKGAKRRSAAPARPSKRTDPRNALSGA